MKDPQKAIQEETGWLSWFEIPVEDFARAKKFYSELFAFDMQEVDLGPLKMGFFPHATNGGAICWGEWYQPAQSGTLIYFNADGQMDTILARVEPAGGRVASPRKLISEQHGYMALFIDTEGNKLALYSKD